MSEEYLTAREFDRWAEDQGKQTERILNGIDDIRRISTDHIQEMATLRAEFDAHIEKHSKAQTANSMVSGGIAVAVTAMVNAIAAVFGHKGV